MFDIQPSSAVINVASNAPAAKKKAAKVQAVRMQAVKEQQAEGLYFSVNNNNLKL